MNQEQLESLNLDDLPYPMFETTEEEKDCLREALPLISEEDREYFLCFILTCNIGSTCGWALRDKIKEVVKKHYTLSDCLGLGS